MLLWNGKRFHTGRTIDLTTKARRLNHFECTGWRRTTQIVLEDSRCVVFIVVTLKCCANNRIVPPILRTHCAPSNAWDDGCVREINMVEKLTQKCRTNVLRYLIARSTWLTKVWQFLVQHSFELFRATEIERCKIISESPLQSIAAVGGSGAKWATQNAIYLQRCHVRNTSVRLNCFQLIQTPIELFHCVHCHAYVLFIARNNWFL